MVPIYHYVDAKFELKCSDARVEAGALFTQPGKSVFRVVYRRVCRRKVADVAPVIDLVGAAMGVNVRRPRG